MRKSGRRVMKKNEDTLAYIASVYGKNTIAETEVKDIPRWSSGIIGLDKILGGTSVHKRGFGKGMVFELYGLPSSGKTTIALHVAKSVQEQGGKVCFIDVEHSFNSLWASAIGVNVKGLVVMLPRVAEDALDILTLLTTYGTFDLIILDSVAMLRLRAEVEGDAGDANMGSKARLLSQNMRNIVPTAKASATTCLLINQVREKIGAWGDTETTPGGHAIGFASAARIKCTKGKQIKQGDMVIGNEVRLETKKNKTAPPYQKTELKLFYTQGGISKAATIADLLVDNQVAAKEGGWYYLPSLEDLKEMKKTSQFSLRDLKEDKLDAVIKCHGYLKFCDAIRGDIDLQNKSMELLEQMGVI